MANAFEKHLRARLRLIGLTLNSDSEILVITGVTEAIVPVCFGQVNFGDEVLIPDLSFPLHALCPKVWQCSFVRSLVGEKWFRQSIDDVVPHIT